MDMSTTTQTAPVYVQQSFAWDECEENSAVALKPPTASLTTRKKLPPSKRTPVTIPKYSETTSVRRGRCEHIGGILASVLEKYGIGLDQLIAEIEKPSTR